MNAIKAFLDAAYPNVPEPLRDGAAAALAPSNPATEDGEFEAAVQMAEDLRAEVGRLNTELVLHRDGVRNASAAGMDVLAERQRQRRLEGYDDEHDDRHFDFSMTSAAIAYALDARLRGTSGQGFDTPPPEWPWSPDEWKPKEIRRSLVVAGALILAEIERIDRERSEQHG